MGRYIMRLDDASDYMDIERWKKMEALLEKYDIKPLFGIIPNNNDPDIIGKYNRNPNFWTLVNEWINKGWVPAMHGYEHRYVTEEGGINPVNRRSEFAGLPYEEQAEKVKKGWEIMKAHNVLTDYFFAPSHTFDENTLKALENETSIRVISDTIAWDTYKRGVFWFVPQQSGRVRKLPFKTVTFCYHPNTMQSSDFALLDAFLAQNRSRFIDISKMHLKTRKIGMIDKILSMMYFSRR